MDPKAEMNKGLKTTGYLCEFGDCMTSAVSEWYWVDREELAAGESGIYATFRCDEHPVKDPDYTERPL